MQANGFFSAVQMPKVPEPYSPPTGNLIRYQKPQVKVWQAPNPEHRHPVFIEFMVRFLQKYATHYFAKVLILGNKTVRDLPKYGGNFQGKRDMCMHHTLENARTLIALSTMHKQMNWMHSMWKMHAQFWHRVWITF